MKKFNYDQIPAGYYDNIYNRKEGIQSSWHHCKFNYVKNFINKKKNILHLDFACGPGTFSKLIKGKYYGVDVSIQQIHYAKKNYSDKKNKYFYYKPPTLPFKNNFFDSVSCIELIEHLTQRQAKIVIKECYRVLKKGGTLYLTTPNYFSLWPLLEYLMNYLLKINYEHQHINKFFKKKLQKLLNASFEKVSIRSFMTFEPFLAFVSFKFSIWIMNFTNKIEIFPGFLLFAQAKKG
jgi:ubiquinone/menaquinone biosynthesis C-methylase UbiE